MSVTTSGGGTATSSPSGIICGTSCNANYASGTTVTLSASAASGYSFAGWSGACGGLGTSCMVSMTAARSVTATFTQSAVDNTATQCSAGGLAAIDLSGQCRASPATMGAIEASSSL